MLGDEVSCMPTKGLATRTESSVLEQARRKFTYHYNLPISASCPFPSAKGYQLCATHELTLSFQHRRIFPLSTQPRLHGTPLKLWQTAQRK